MMAEGIQLQGVLLGIAVCMAAGTIIVLVLLFPGRALTRRVADWLFNRRGVEKLGVPMRIRPRKTPYEMWLLEARGALPVHDCLYIEDVRTVALEPWEQLGAGVSGLYLRFSDYQICDGRLFEIPPGGSTVVSRHLFEMNVHFLGGPGHTVLFDDAGQTRKIEWNNRSVLSVPLNARYRHFNDGENPVRVFAVTSFPFVLNSINSPAFIENNPFFFADRMGNEPNEEAGEDTAGSQRKFAGFIADAMRENLVDRPLRGKAVRNRYWTLHGNSALDLNLSEMDGRTIKRAHRANSDAVVLMLSGTGCFVTWPDGAWRKNIQVPWRDGTLMAAPIYWYRQFLNSGEEASRNLTFSAKLLVEKLGVRFLDQMENDLPEIRKIWSKHLGSG